MCRVFLIYTANLFHINYSFLLPKLYFIVRLVNILYVEYDNWWYLSYMFKWNFFVVDVNNIYYLIIIVEGSNHELEVNPLIYQSYTDMIFWHKLLEASF